VPNVHRDLTKYHSDAETYAAISAVYSLNKARLLKIAKGYSIGVRLDAPGLLHEAIARTLHGIRAWRRDVDIIRHLDQTMRSIRYAERTRMKHWREEHCAPYSRLSKDGQTLLTLVGIDSYRSEDPTAEELLLEHQMYNQIQLLHTDDQIAQRIIYGLVKLCQEKQDLMLELDISSQEYETKLKKIRRRISNMQELWS
jgi:hypothetical protein